MICDAKDDGRKALQILLEHLFSRGKSRNISSYIELTSLRNSSGEAVIDYVFTQIKKRMDM